ncbi:MAG: hypothetical protein WA933_06850 [Microcoleaceae cyanobacterium]
MESWEFLLQREEDTTWLPLESSDVEILEGRYRIVARSGYSETEIKIRITHHAYEETPPIRRVQTRSTTTTSEGLMVVIPYTRLKPGIWEMCCSPNTISDSFPISQQQSIKLRVFSQDAELGESPQSNFPAATVSVTTDSNSDTTHLTLGDRPNLPELIESVSEINHQTQSVTETTPIELQPSTTNEDWVKWDALSESISVSNHSSESAETMETTQTTQSPPLELTLNQTAYVAKLGEGFLVSGQVHSPDQTETSGLSLTEPHLQVCLRNPQTGEVLTETQQTVPSTELPMIFSVITYLPFECKTRLILAEISLYSQTLPVARQTFTITTEVEHLLQAIEEDFTETDSLESLAEELPNNPAFYLALPLEPELEQPQSLQSPELAPVVEQPTTGQLELPVMGRFLSEAPTTTPASITSSSSEISDSTSVVETQPDQTDQIKPLSPEELEFKHLNIQDRFWTRLNALASDQDLSQWMKKTTPKALPETPLLPTTIQPSTAKDYSDVRQDAILDASSYSIPEESESQEIVIDDEPLETSPALFPRRPATPQLQLVPARNNNEDVDRSGTLPDNQPIPAPILQILSDEVIAGRSIAVRVRLPQDLPRVYIKIWVYDRQARSIIDGPRWLTEFAPNGLEQIETTVNLDIAYGSLEVQIEAIAVEMQTQRESQKVTIERTVIPPSEPSLPLEED